MAKLGIRTVEEMVGRSDLLKARKNVITDRAETVDLSRILNNPWLDQPEQHLTRKRPMTSTWSRRWMNLSCSRRWGGA